MKTFLRHTAAVLLLGYAAISAHAQEIRIGFINTDRIFKEANTAKQAQAKLEQEFSKREKDLNDSGNALKTAVEKFERRVAEMMTIGAKDMAMAMRWIHEAEDTQGDNDYLAWTLGLPYRYFAKQPMSV